MGTGALTGYLDVAQVVLYVFWAFFAGLIIYLRREDKREGYPLDSDRTERTNRVIVQGFPAIPTPKTFRLAHGGTVQAPDGRADDRPIKAVPAAYFPGAALTPTGNPMIDGVGPAAYAARSDTPDLTLEGHPRMVPLRVDPEFSVSPEDPDPRGWPVIAGDGEQAGVVHELWVDRTEPQISFVEVTVDAAGGPRNVLVPIGFARFDTLSRSLRVRSILSHQFADVPATASADRITLREEDRIMGYFAGGTLYAEPSRLGPLI
jgi:photosynthetic reaction center H subunit